MLDKSTHSISVIKDEKIDDKCNILSIFNIFWCESNNHDYLEKNNINGDVELVKI